MLKMYRLLIFGKRNRIYNFQYLTFNFWKLSQLPEDGFIIEQQSNTSLYSCSYSAKTSAEFSRNNLVFLLYYYNINYYALSLKFLSKLKAIFVRDSMDNIKIVRVIYNQNNREDYIGDKKKYQILCIWNRYFKKIYEQNNWFMKLIKDWNI